MKTFALAAALVALTSTSSLAETYSIIITNTLDTELLAPIVVTSAANDEHFFEGDYVTPEAEEQILTGDPAKVVARIGETMAAVGHGTDGPPGVLLDPGTSVTIIFETDAPSLRILAMVAPTVTPDNYVSAVIPLDGSEEIITSLDRFDIGHDEGTRKLKRIGADAALVEIVRK